jgi:hypothetical protein
VLAERATHPGAAFAQRSNADKCDREPHLRPSAFATNWNGRSIG